MKVISIYKSLDNKTKKKKQKLQFSNFCNSQRLSSSTFDQKRDSIEKKKKKTRTWKM